MNECGRFVNDVYNVYNVMNVLAQDRSRPSELLLPIGSLAVDVIGGCRELRCGGCRQLLSGACGPPPRRPRAFAEPLAR